MQGDEKERKKGGRRKEDRGGIIRNTYLFTLLPTFLWGRKKKLFSSTLLNNWWNAGLRRHWLLFSHLSTTRDTWAFSIQSRYLFCPSFPFSLLFSLLCPSLHFFIFSHTLLFFLSCSFIPLSSTSTSHSVHSIPTFYLSTSTILSGVFLTFFSPVSLLAVRLHSSLSPLSLPPLH